MHKIYDMINCLEANPGPMLSKHNCDWKHEASRTLTLRMDEVGCIVCIVCAVK